MAEAEQPERATRKINIEDLHQLMGASTPHFALQLRARIEKLIANLPSDDPVRIEGEREIERLAQLAVTGETRGPSLPDERPLPSLSESEIPVNPGTET